MSDDRDPAEARALDLEAALLDAIEVLTGINRLRTMRARTRRIERLRDKLLALADELQDARDEIEEDACTHES